MRLKTTLILSSLLTAALAVSITIVVLWTGYLLDDASRKITIARELSKGSLQLNILTHDYLTHSSDRAKDQWLSQYNMISKILDSSEFLEEDTETILQIKGEHENIKSVFDQLVESQNLGSSDEYSQRLSNQLSIHSESLSTEAFNLVDKVLENNPEINKTSGQLVLIVPLVFIGAIFGIVVYSNRNILKSVTSLIRTTRKFQKGELDATINHKVVNSQNEIGELAKALDKMRNSIKESLKEIKKSELQKEEFASMVTHELKTPLTPIKGYCEMLKEPDLIGTLNSEQLDAIQEIEENSNQLEHLISDVLDAQKIDMKRMKFNQKHFELDEFMKGVYENYLPLMKTKNIEFVNTTNAKLALTSDPNRLEQVLSNLIKNAFDFVPEQGRIEIGATAQDSKVLFYVKDNGMGIAKENQKNLFKKFYQIDTSITRKHGGTGLGLSICHGIVIGLGGKIWVESELGKGASFFFSVPIEVKARVRQ